MSYSSSSSSVSTVLIVGAVVGAVVGLAICIGCIVIIICLVKHSFKPRTPIQNGVVLQPYAPYPDNISNYPPQYPNYPPPYQNNAPNYPPQDSSIDSKIRPPYPTSESEFTRPPNA
jgi:hypothetical protein